MKVSLKKTILSNQFSLKLRLFSIGLNVLFGRAVSLILSFDTIKDTKFELMVQIFHLIGPNWKPVENGNGLNLPLTIMRSRDHTRHKKKDDAFWGHHLSIENFTV